MKLRNAVQYQKDMWDYRKYCYCLDHCYQAQEFYREIGIKTDAIAFQNKAAFYYRKAAAMRDHIIENYGENA